MNDFSLYIATERLDRGWITYLQNFLCLYIEMTNSLLLVTLSIDRDDSLGRVGKSSLSQQTIMELLLSGFITKDPICNQNKPTDYSDWFGVEMNSEGTYVDVIRWDWLELSGSLSLKWLPASVSYLTVFENYLEGTIALGLLEDSMKRLVLSSNRFSGSLDLGHLPSRMEWLKAADNDFEGSVSLKNLPNSLVILDLSHNKFGGEIVLSSLPQKMEDLYVQSNQFVSEIDLNCLPKNMQRLNVSSNELSGSVDSSRIPNSVSVLNVSNTNLEGEILVKKWLLWGFNVENSGVKKLVTE